MKLKKMDYRTTKTKDTLQESEVFIECPNGLMDVNCWEKDDRCNDCPIDYPQKQCSEYHIFKL